MKDVQNQSDSRGVEIQKVGIKDFEIPIVIQRKDAEDKVIYASATCGVTLPAHYKGTHMSRFVEVLNEKNILFNLFCSYNCSISIFNIINISVLVKVN